MAPVSGAVRRADPRAVAAEFLRRAARAGIRFRVSRCPKCGEPGYLYAHPRRNRIYVRHYDYHDIEAAGSPETPRSR